MAVGKEIKQKIGSINNTRKITSAMEMVAASKMRKAQTRMSAGRPYAEKIRAVVGHVALSQHLSSYSPAGFEYPPVPISPSHL